MNNKTRLLIGLLFISIQGFGQTFRIELNQPEQLWIYPGNDTTICKTHSVRLGSVSTATGGAGDYIFMWLPTDGLDNPTSPNPVATPEVNTKYVLTVTDANGCSASESVNITVDQCLGVDKKGISEKLALFPNPSFGSFTISGLPADGSSTSIVILNSTGTEISRQTLTPGQDRIYLDLSGQNLPRGVYIIRIMNDQLVLTRRIQMI